MSDSSMSDSDSNDDHDHYSGVHAGSNSIADATDGSQSEIDEDSYDSDSADSQSVSTRSSSSYQTDVTVSSEASSGEDEEDDDDGNMSSAESQASGGAGSEGEYTPVEVSSGDDSDVAEVFNNDILEVNRNEVEEAEIQDIENEEEIQEVDNDEEIQAVPNQEARVIHLANEAPEAALEIPEPLAEKVENEPQPGPSKETEKNKTKTAKKRSASQMESEDDDDQLCPICFDPWKGTGTHRIVSLKCGHLFGRSCVEKWVKKNKKCPKCNQLNKMTDVRPIFAPTIKVKEAPEEARLIAELKKALEEKRELELKLLRKEQEMKTMQEQSEKNSSNMRLDKRNANQERRFGDRKYGMKLVKESGLSHGGGRVMAFCPWDTQLSVSKASAMTGFGLRMFNCEREFMVQNVESFHNQPIRDMEYCPNRTNNILLTASIDKSAKMIDYRSNSVVQTYRTVAPAWSCCWDSTGQSDEIHKISIGLANGEIARFDIRMPGAEPCMVLGKKVFGNGQDITAIPSLVSIPAGFSRSLPRGAVVACHLKSCHVFIGDEDVNGIKLPFEGPFSCLRCEPVTGHLLLSSKRATHTVFRILKDRSVEPVNLFEPVLHLDGGNKAQSVLARSAVTTINQGSESKLLVAASEEKSVKIWSVSDGGNQISNSTMSDVVMDVCGLSFNHRKYFAFLSDKKVNMFEMIMR